MTVVDPPALEKSCFPSPSHLFTSLECCCKTEPTPAPEPTQELLFSCPKIPRYCSQLSAATCSRNLSSALETRFGQRPRWASPCWRESPARAGLTGIAWLVWLSSSQCSSQPRLYTHNVVTYGFRDTVLPYVAGSLSWQGLSSWVIVMTVVQGSKCDCCQNLLTPRQEDHELSSAPRLTSQQHLLHCWGSNQAPSENSKQPIIYWFACNNN